ncbi:MAG: amidase [Deltaproteobacteria bacterium]|nr:amidase [Deltaproteobacteria bacterium]
MSEAKLLTASATELAAWIREGRVTSRKVIDAHIAQVERVNPTINAVVRNRYDEARQEADAADAALRTGDANELPLLHGVPCTIKECFALEGMPQTSGLLSRVGKVSGTDASAVARLRAAGAIPLGVTNISELCMWMESANRVYGRTNNPYDPTRTVGGSSGGEGAIVAAGGSPFGLGSDVGGSIRMPAFFNGVFGHKPTGGVVPNTGQFPITENAGLRYLSTGPITRRAEDLMPLLRVLAGPDGMDTECRPAKLEDPDSVDISRLDVVSIEWNGLIPVGRELRAAQARTMKALSALGARVRTAQVKGLRRSLGLWSSMLADASSVTFRELLGNGTPFNARREILRWALGKSPHTLPAIGLAVLERFPESAPEYRRQMLQLGREVRNELVDLIGPSGVLLYPSYPTLAPKHGIPMIQPFYWVYTAVLNVMELPVTQVPLGLNGAGLPLGVQVVATHGNDHVTIAVAMALEQAFGGWVPPPCVAR